ncbi:hypothetical protein FA95DRAFT_827564 [Auriscalpium vulgare]|uniref:Uncharacterized protein n=1 Tax=Auriscalpium vulgare TaxID=40419 RepID=A0ACB8R969_9AGAM|nr:hypothetical protein FA95DRAFT_827564 [Auriscalpium vulgare]
MSRGTCIQNALPSCRQRSRHNAPALRDVAPPVHASGEYLCPIPTGTMDGVTDVRLANTTPDEPNPSTRIHPGRASQSVTYASTKLRSSKPLPPPRLHNHLRNPDACRPLTARKLPKTCEFGTSCVALGAPDVRTAAAIELRRSSAVAAS